jgi:uncharacterized membrane protein YebE (DUF533 family)
MIRELIGAGTIASMLMPNKKKHRRMMPKMSTAATLVGIGVGAYLAYKNQTDKNSHNNDRGDLF